MFLPSTVTFSPRSLKRSLTCLASRRSSSSSASRTWPCSSRSTSGMALASSSRGRRRPMPSASTATPKGRPWAIRLSIEVSRTSTRRDSRMGSSRGNSSAITVRVAPADFPMPRARWPAERPMATTRYHRWVVMASVIRLLTRPISTLLAVSKPKVGAPPGSGRSLSMVWHVRHAQPPSGRLGQPGRRERGVVPADRHQRVDPQLPQRLKTSVQPPVRVGGALVAHRRVSPRGPDDRPALNVDPRHVRDGQRPRLLDPALDEVLEAVHDPQDIPPGVPGLNRGRRDNRVHPRGRAAAAQDPQLHAPIVPATRRPDKWTGPGSRNHAPITNPSGATRSLAKELSMTATTQPTATALASSAAMARMMAPRCWLDARPQGARNTLARIVYRISCFSSEPQVSSAKYGPECSNARARPPRRPALAAAG